MNNNKKETNRSTKTKLNLGQGETNFKKESKAYTAPCVPTITWFFPTQDTFISFNNIC